MLLQSLMYRALTGRIKAASGKNQMRSADFLQKLQNAKVAFGTANMAKGPAMTKEQAHRCVEAGISIAEDMVLKDTA